MPMHPRHHPLADRSEIDRGHIARRTPSHRHDGRRGRAPTSVGRRLRDDQDGSVATEYGLLAVVAATIVSVLLEWATSGGITDLLASVLARVSELVGL